ncbi:unnamed protein product [Linum tenue]|uniref:Homeobox-leucine zipper protein n=1 Tax=Linum tenue TaxID=586396 RepID=A0AAV0QV59_9ROSI|nr:unnamed protein product [Linum tenue]
MAACASGRDVGGLGTVLLQTHRGGASQPLESFFLPSSSSPSFLGPRSIVRFDDSNGSTTSRPFFTSFDADDNGDDDLDEYFRQPEKKRRLSVDQVQFLEKSFEVENKLEPERKIQLAKDLGLQPRQVAIWFQNRRARWKTKRLEKDYDLLQSSYDTLKADYDGLLREKDKLKAEVINSLTDKLQKKEKATGSLDLAHNDAMSREIPLEKPSLDSASGCKQEDISSARSDIFDADSPHYTDGVVHSSLLEAGDSISSYVFEPDNQSSDLSQDEDDHHNNNNSLCCRNLLPDQYVFPKLEDEDYSDPPASFEDQAFWSSWS